jgi:hypothetical protein
MRTFFFAPSFFAIFVGAALPAIAGSALEFTQTPQDIRGVERESGLSFAATTTSKDRVVIDTYIGTKQIHAEIDYNLRRLAIRSLSATSGRSVELSAQDVIAFQNLLAASSALDTRSRHGEALASFISLMANAPASAIDISGSNVQTFTSICNTIHKPAVATYYTLGGAVHKSVTVGPVCYIAPALGRCGVGGGPDPGIGLVQRFTQECLNHDVCVGAIGTLLCVPEFNAAAPGFFFAPDCGTTQGTWTDNRSRTFTLSGGDGSGAATGFTGSVACGTWTIVGTRTGRDIAFRATNPAGASQYCTAWFNYSGSYSDCSMANGSLVNSAGFSGVWSWSRTSPAPAQSAGANLAQSP